MIGAIRMPFPHIANTSLLVAAGFGLALLASTAGRAYAASDFAGTWAADLANCKAPQSKANAPFIITQKGYDQHEAHCTFKTLKPVGGSEWKGVAECSVEGDNQAFDVDLIVSGNTLTLTEDGNPRDLLRCP